MNPFPAWWASTKTLFDVPARQTTLTGGIDSLESIPGLLNIYKFGLRRDHPARDSGHEHLISNIGRFKPAFAEREAENDRSPKNLDKLILKPVMYLN